DDGLGPGALGRYVITPVEAGLGDHAFGRDRGAIYGGVGQVLQARERVVADLQGKGPALQVNDGRGPGIQQELVGVVAVAFERAVRTFDAIAVELAGLNTSKPDVPDIAGAVLLRGQLEAVSGRAGIRRGI